MNSSFIGTADAAVCTAAIEAAQSAILRLGILASYSWKSFMWVKVG
jgi:hypothetical protein